MIRLEAACSVLPASADDNDNMASYSRAGEGSGYQQASSRTGDFQGLSTSLSSNIQKLSKSVKEVEAVVSQIGTAHDSEQLTGRLRDLQQNAKKLADNAKTQLQQLTQLSKSPSASPDQRRQQKAVVERLTDELTRVLNQLQRVQRDAVEKEKQSVQRARANSASANMFADDEVMDYNGGQPVVSKQQTLQALADEEENLQAIVEREEAIKRLQADIIGVNEIFKDLSTMVLEQGEMIDSIDAHVESTVVHVEQANTQLVQAQHYQASARRKKCICITIIIVALIVIVTVIVVPLVVKSNSS